MCEGIQGLSSPQVTASRNRGHYLITSKKAKGLEAHMSSKEDPKVQKDPAWLAVNDSLLDLEHSKVRPTDPRARKSEERYSKLRVSGYSLHTKR